MNSVRRSFAAVVVALAVSLQLAHANGLPNIVILATGGTIAGAAATGTQSGYTSGAVGIDTIMLAQAARTLARKFKDDLPAAPDPKPGATY